MQSRRWLRPLVAFVITFGVAAMVGSVVRVVAVYQQFAVLGFQPDNGEAIPRLQAEVSRLDHQYAPIFLAVAVMVSGLSAVLFGLWRPAVKIDVPPPLPPLPRDGV